MLTVLDGSVQALQALCTPEAKLDRVLCEGHPLIDQLYQGFQAVLTDTAITSSGTNTVQRSITEVHRLLRLLQTDFALYRAARTPDSQQQRLQPLREHANQLAHYWQVLRAI